MIRLYHCADARSFRPLWALEEIGLDYELELLPFPPRVKSPIYLDLNPLGTVPLFIDGATRMTESVAICHYLAVRYGDGAMAVDAGEPMYGAFLNALHFGEATLTFPQTLVLRYGMFEQPSRRQPQVVDDYSQWFLSRLRAVEAIITDEQFLCAGRFTMADISVGYAIMLAQLIGLGDALPPATRAYWQRLSDRPGFHRAKTAQGQATEGLSARPAYQDIPG